MASRLSIDCMGQSNQHTPHPTTNELIHNWVHSKLFDWHKTNTMERMLLPRNVEWSSMLIATSFAGWWFVRCVHVANVQPWMQWQGNRSSTSYSHIINEVITLWIMTCLSEAALLDGCMGHILPSAHRMNLLSTSTSLLFMLAGVANLLHFVSAFRRSILVWFSVGIYWSSL